jgi:hypothetical protein
MAARTVDAFGGSDRRSVVESDSADLLWLGINLGQGIKSVP